jgi:hypothetical protein
MVYAKCEHYILTGNIKDRMASISCRKIVTPILNTRDFIDRSRIGALKDIKIKDFDLIRLIKYCEELNFNFKYGNYLSVAE